MRSDPYVVAFSCEGTEEDLRTALVEGPFNSIEDADAFLRSEVFRGRVVTEEELVQAGNPAVK